MGSGARPLLALGRERPLEKGGRRRRVRSLCIIVQEEGKVSRNGRKEEKRESSCGVHRVYVSD